MSLLRLLTSACVVVSMTAGCAPQPGGVVVPTPGGGQDGLVQATQELLDAIAPGKKDVWEHYLADDAIYTDENGRSFTKKEFLEELKPLPAYAHGTLKIKHSLVRLSSDHAVIVHQDEETEDIYGQKIVTGFVITDTWRLRQGRWELMASSVVGLHSDPAVVKLSSARLDAFAGEYTVASATSFTVRREGDHLNVTRDGRPPVALYPEADGLFFSRGSSDRWAFVADDSGAIAEMRQRRRGNDVVWKKKRP